MARRSWRTALAVLALVGTAAACGGGEDEVSDDDVAAELAFELEGAAAGLSAEAAECVAGVLVEELGADTIQDIDLTADAPPEDEQEAFVEAVQQASTDCDVDLAALGQ
jgi:ABC-type glycerol-3-phosphate transport system substrate-binding protein